RGRAPGSFLGPTAPACDAAQRSVAAPAARVPPLRLLGKQGLADPVANDCDLEASLERFEFAAEAAGIGVWDWNLTSGRWWVGAHFAARYGLDVSATSPEAELTRI